MCIDSQYIPVDESQMEHVEATEEEEESHMSERAQLIAAILPLLERMPMDWLRAIYIMAQKWAGLKE